ncbi:MAG: hypothetical protein E6H58_13505 [Betaproteobacteria bacterium]|nr:MAG: hypothetical protein E6H58_13505 [Betaproteobacteria bacterium]
MVPWTSLTIPDAYFLTHELGHVMGAQHEDTAPGNPFTFSRAIINPPANSGSAPGPQGDPDGCVRGWKTIMATSNNCGSCMTIGQWSTPDARHQHCGKLTGVRNSRDNAETIRKTAWTVANIRCSTSSPPSASVRPPRNSHN